MSKKLYEKGFLMELNVKSTNDEMNRLMPEFVEIRGKRIFSVRDSNTAYDLMHNSGFLCQKESFYKWLLCLLQTYSGKKILDVSCGQGSLLRYASEQGMNGYGLDIAFSAVKISKEQSLDINVCVADAERLPYADDSFDIITNIGSLEHYFHPFIAVREMVRVLQSNGQALVLLPNTFGLFGNIVHVLLKGDVFDDGQPLQRYGTRIQWQKLLEQNGLMVQKTIKYEREWPRTFKDLLWYILRPFKIFRIIASWFIPVNLSSFFVFLCCKQK